MSRLSATISTSWAFVISLRTSVTPVDEKLGFQTGRFGSQASGGWVAKSRRYEDLRDGYLP
jgi:hypothetical protein